MTEFENLQEAQKLDTKINNKIQFGDKDENNRLFLEKKILQYYIAFSDFKVPFNEWIKEYLKDVLPQ